MPHDKNGIEIKAGDIVRIPADDFMPHEKIGSVVSVCKGSDTCNLSVNYIGKRAQSGSWESLPELLLGQAITATKCERLA